MTEHRTAWTHASVVAMAVQGDPLAIMINRARQLVWQAVEKGWSGPPFDPFQLADLLRIKTVPREDIRDARIVPLGGDAFAIEFNPNRPGGRLRYSVAHELAHALLPDCGEMIRNRSHRGEMSGDEWQLEMLCNVAASELLMPTGTFPQLADEADLSITHLMALRQRFDVSAEALLLRVVRLTSQSCFMFAASRVGDSERKSRYRLEYAVPARTCPVRLRRGSRVPAKTLLGECTGIGFTNHGTEKWPDGIGRVALECVGIPPYPGRIYPRVVGIGRKTSGAASKLPSIKYVVGDATRPHGSEEILIVFVVNDKATRWGGGFAKVIRFKWPEIHGAFRTWATARRDRLKLGNVYFSEPHDGLGIAAIVAQHGYGPCESPRIRYSALAQCLDKVAVVALERQATVHMPRIGCGEAGGDWQIVSELIDESLCGEGICVTVYDLPHPSPSRPSSIVTEANHDD